MRAGFSPVVGFLGELNFSAACLALP